MWGTRTSPGPSGTQAPGASPMPGVGRGSRPLAALSAWSAPGYLPHPQTQLPCRIPHSLHTHRGRTVLSVTVGCWSWGRGGLRAEAPAEAPRPSRAPAAPPPASPPLPEWRAPGCAGAGGGNGAGRGGARAGDPPPAPRPLPRRLADLGHLPQPMSASRGGPWKPGLRLLRAAASAVGKQNPGGTVPVERAPQPGGPAGGGAPSRAPHSAVPRGAERSRRSPPRRPGPTWHHCLRSTHGDQETLKEFGVPGAGKSRVRKGGFLCLGDVFSSMVWTLCPVGGRGIGGLKGGSPHNPHAHAYTALASPCLPLPLCSLILDRAASPWRSRIDCAGEQAERSGAECTVARCAPCTGVGASVGVRASVGLGLGKRAGV